MMLVDPIYREQIAQISTDVFHSMLHMDVHGTDDVQLPSAEVGSRIRFEGSWRGAFGVECSMEQAFELTSRLMRIPKPEALNEDVVDALGEVANIIGGNLKALLPAKTTLSIPESFAIDPTASVFDSEVLRIVLEGEIGKIAVVVSGDEQLDQCFIPDLSEVSE